MPTNPKPQPVGTVFSAELRRLSDELPVNVPVWAIACAQLRVAADLVDELRRQVATLRAALEPFARVGARYPKGDGDRHMGYDLRTGDYRRARDALRADPTEPEQGT